MRRFLPAAFAALVVSTSVSSDALAAPWNRRNAETIAAERADAPLVREAGGYAVFQDDVGALEDAPFASLDDIDTALETISSHNPAELSRSWIAYSALVAAQEPSFVDGVREAADYYGRDAMLAGLRNDPSYAGQLIGAEDARQAVLSSVTYDARRISEISELVKSQAYSLQSNSWAKVRSRDNSARIARLEAIALEPRGASADTLFSLGGPGAIGSDRIGERSAEARANFWSALRLGPTSAHAATPGVPVAANPRYRSVLDQVVTLAALEALDAAGPQDASAISPLLDHRSMNTCMVMARLHFQQCIAASAFRYEDPFCIAEHGVKDIGNCFSRIASQ